MGRAVALCRRVLPALLVALPLVGCSLDLTGAACTSNANCPLHQHCQLPLGEKKGVCQSGEGVFAALAIDANQRLLPLGGTAQAFATLTTDGGPPAPDGGLVTELVEWSVPPDSVGLISVSDDAGTRGQVVALAPGQATLAASMIFAGQRLEAFNTIVVSNAELQRIVAVSDRLQYAAGTAGSAAATGFFSDGTHADLTSLVKWSSSVPTVLSISNASGSWGRMAALASGRATVLATYLALYASTSVSVSDAKLVSLSISPLHPRAPEGSDLQLEATGVFSDGSAQPMTRTVQWSLDDPSLGVFSSGSPGNVTLLTPGSTTARAVAAAAQTQARLDVIPFAPVQLEISPAWPDPLLLGSSTRLSAWSTHPDGTVASAPPTWASTDPALSVSPLGDLLAVVPGLSSVVATAGPLEARAPAEATGEAPVSWLVWPPELAVPLGAEATLSLERAHADGTVQDLTSVTGWRQADTDAGVIDVETGDRGGTVRPRQPGTRLAVLGVLPGRTARAWIRTPDGVPTLEIVPPAVSFPTSGRVRLAAVGHWPDGTVVDLTAVASWRASPGLVLVGNGPSAGVVLGADAGAGTMIAAFDGASAQTALSAELDGGTLEVWPPGAVVAAGTALPLQITLVSASGDSTDVSADARWTSSVPRVAIATNAPGQSGQLLGRTAGTAVLTARLDAFLATVPVLVTGATLQRLDVQAPAAVVTWAPARFRALGRFSDGTTQDLTRWVSWTASDPGVLRIRGTGPDRGDARGIDSGVVDVEARPRTASPIVDPPVSVTVNGTSISSISVTGPAGPVAVGTRPRVQAMAHAADGTGVDVTGVVEWTSSDPSVARVSSLVRPGSVTTAAPGTAVLAARLGGVSGSAPLQVIADGLTGLSITAPGTLHVGSAATATATATLSGGGSQALEEDVVWSSDAPGVLGVSNAPGGRGRLLGLSAGTTTLRARTRTGLQPGAQASAVVTVTPAALRTAPPADR